MLKEIDKLKNINKKIQKKLNDYENNPASKTSRPHSSSE